MSDDNMNIAACVVCGCTEEAACPGGCCWVEDPARPMEDVCSRCTSLRSDQVRLQLGDGVWYRISGGYETRPGNIQVRREVVDRGEEWTVWARAGDRWRLLRARTRSSATYAHAGAAKRGARLMVAHQIGLYGRDPPRPPRGDPAGGGKR